MTGPYSTTAQPGERRIRVRHSAAWSLSPGYAVPGWLELTADGLEFRPNSTAWLVAGLGCRRDFAIPRECLSSATASFRLAGMLRGWPVRILAVRLSSGRELLFGISDAGGWAREMAGAAHPGPACPDVDRQLSRITLTSLADAVATTAAIAACLAVVFPLSDVLAYAGLGALLVGRLLVRARCSRTPHHRHPSGKKSSGGGSPQNH